MLNQAVATAAAPPPAPTPVSPALTPEEQRANLLTTADLILGQIEQVRV